MNINNPTTFSTPNLTLSTSNSSGTSGALRADDTIALYTTNVPESISYGQSASTGNSEDAARRNHNHGMAALDQIDVATQAEMEAASSTTKAVSPGRTIYHPGVAKAWCSISSTGSLESGDWQISTVTDTGTGDRTINYTTAFSGSTYAIASACIGEPSGGVATFQFRSRGTSSVQLVVKNPSNTGIDVASTQVFFGDL